MIREIEHEGQRGSQWYEELIADCLLEEAPAELHCDVRGKEVKR